MDSKTPEETMAYLDKLKSQVEGLVDTFKEKQKKLNDDLKPQMVTNKTINGKTVTASLIKKGIILSFENEIESAKYFKEIIG